MNYFKNLLFLVATVVAFSACNKDDGNDITPVLQEGLTVTIQDAFVSQPAKVSVFFKVSKKNGAPVADLQDSDFVIYEKGRNDSKARKISADEAKRQISPNSRIFSYSTLLVLDLSGSVTNNKLSALQSASKEFIQQVLPEAGDTSRQLGIWWFDGEDELHTLVPMTSNKAQLLAAIDAIEPDLSQDRSTDLYGAVIKSTAKAEEILEQRSDIISAASVVIFTDGTDQAARYTEASALNAVNKADKNLTFYTIGLGNEIDESVLKAIGKSSSAFAANTTDLLGKFTEIAQSVYNEAHSYYLFEYCSPKRDGSGTNELTIEAIYNNFKGSAKTTFDATGFTGGCSL